MQYKQTLPLNDHEVVLTFDDGPLPPYSNSILDTLDSQCVKATYFLVGEMAHAYPAIGAAHLQCRPHHRHSQPGSSARLPASVAAAGRTRGRRRHRLGRCGAWRSQSGSAVFPHSWPRPLQYRGRLPRRAFAGDLERRRGRRRLVQAHQRRNRSCSAPCGGSMPGAAASCCCTTSIRQPRWRCRPCSSNSRATAIMSCRSSLPASGRRHCPNRGLAASAKTAWPTRGAKPARAAAKRARDAMRQACIAAQAPGLRA